MKFKMIVIYLHLKTKNKYKYLNQKEKKIVLKSLKVNSTCMVPLFGVPFL